MRKTSMPKTSSIHLVVSIQYWLVTDRVKWGKRWWGLGMQWHQLDHMQTICTSLQTDSYTNTSSLNFYRPDALPDAKPTESKHWRHMHNDLVSEKSFKRETQQCTKHWHSPKHAVSNRQSSLTRFSPTIRDCSSIPWQTSGHPEYLQCLTYSK